MRPLGLRITYELMLGAILVASLLVIFRLSRQLAESRRQNEANAQSLRLLQQALLQKDLQQNPPLETEGIPKGGEQGGVARREAVIERLDRELAETRATMTDLQSQIASAKEQDAKALTDAQERLQKQQGDARAQMEDLQKKLDAAETDAGIARQRAAALEADNAKLRTDTTVDKAYASEFSKNVATLQDLENRREIYLTSMQRRYRDITSEFRAMSSMLDTNRDPNSNVCSGAALSRIQNAVTLADDDMRQLNELNARAQKLQKQILKK